MSRVGHLERNIQVHLVMVFLRIWNFGDTNLSTAPRLVRIWYNNRLYQPSAAVCPFSFICSMAYLQKFDNLMSSLFYCYYYCN